ncbi:hypothetical protein NDU88_007053 [Pleurodeles waltl]|uniref:Uncharacterized protein n=1 Tax=Pleurodeles waltl TaxID=8319 RepID=A0AAV7UMS9_PLEWA|nr:hypothetical protein NDU88_007053 [Pleurodeles waltl]
MAGACGLAPGCDLSHIPGPVRHSSTEGAARDEPLKAPQTLRRSQPPRPIIACLLRHTQAQQLLQMACSHGPFRMNEQMIRMTADFSKETSESREAFLAHLPRLHQLEMKFGLFEPARMWITKNNVSKDFYDPEDLCIFLDCLQTGPMDTATPLQPQSLFMATTIQSPQEPARRDCYDKPQTFHPREET